MSDYDPSPERLMQRLRRIAPSATIQPVPKPSGSVGQAVEYYLDLDGQRGVVRFDHGGSGVWLLNGSNTWEHFGVPKRSRGADQAQKVYRAIVNREQIEAARVAAMLASRAAEEARVAVERAQRDAISKGANELRARFDALLAERGLQNSSALRFFVPGAERSSYMPSYVPRTATFQWSPELTPERAAKLLDVLKENGFL